jgi:drug/metabolite transporter (DMT)-like permease
VPLLIAALIVGSALLHAFWNALLKRQRDPEGASVALLAVAGASAAAIAVALRGAGPSFPSAAGLGWALAAGLCEGGYFVTLALAFRAAPFGMVYAIARGGSLALVWPVSVLLLGEGVTPLAVGGALGVAAGLALLGLERLGDLSGRGVAWAAACAACIAGYHLSYKAALATSAAPPAIFATGICVALPVALARLGPGGWRRAVAALRDGPVGVTAAGLLCTASFLAFLVALARGGAGAALTLRNSSVVFALALAWLMGERPGRRQVAGTLGVALGAVLIGWPR